MKVTADTNVLVRLVVADDKGQGLAASTALKEASLVAISTHSPCELAWVLSSRYNVSHDDVASALRGLCEAILTPAIALG